MKILIVGAKGRLGAALARKWGETHDIATLFRPELDVTNSSRLESLLAGYDFDVLVNGAAMTNVDRCESDRDEAIAVNVRAPQIMATAARKRGARFIHFSTDYVFDGKKIEPYCEDDEAYPLGWYGQTKLDGEKAVLSDAASHLIVRVSWVFGPDKPSFVDMILERARKNSKVEAVADKFSSPTFACDVADWLAPFFDLSLPGGIFHASNAGGCSWREYGAFALECAEKCGIPLATTQVASLSLAEMKQFIAPRPANTILSTTKLTRTIGIAPRSWKDAVSQYIREKYAPISSPA